MSFLQKLSIFLLALIFVSPLQAENSSAITYSKAKNLKESRLTAREKKLWREIIKPYLQSPLWNSENYDDAESMLMVPLHAAFKLNRKNWQKDFYNQFTAYYPERAKLIPNTSPAKYGYLYMISRFMVLAARSKQPELVSQELVRHLVEEIRAAWVEDSIGMWTQGTFAGIKDRLIWRLNEPSVTTGYYKALVDVEFYLFAIAADLLQLQKFMPLNLSSDDTAMLDEMMSYCKEVLTSQIVHTNIGGWLLQPGAWKDHNDFAFAGSEVFEPKIFPKLREDVSWDSSHFHRMSLWLKSYEERYDRKSADAVYYRTLRQSLAKQFHGAVLTKPSKSFPFYRTKNFMNGGNGVYRYQYYTAQDDDGFGPYELSVTLLACWATFLESGKEERVFKHIARSYPFPKYTRRTYVGASTNRKRHPLIMNESWFENGFGEIQAKLAARIAGKDKRKIDNSILTQSNYVASDSTNVPIPISNYVINGEEITVYWPATPGAEKYSLRIDAMLPARRTALDITFYPQEPNTGMQSYKVTSGLVKGERYFVWVWARKKGRWGEGTVGARFSIGLPAPTFNFPATLSPAHETVISWNSQEDYSKYELWLSLQDKEAPLTFRVKDIIGKSTSLNPNDYKAGKYKAWVRGYQGVVPGDWSEVGELDIK